MAYTNIDDPSAYFQTAIYNGQSGTQFDVTNDGNSDLQPDLIWFKDRGAAYSHYLVDSSRGRAKGLKSDTTAAETTSGQTNWDLVSFNSDGFEVGAPSEGESTNAGTTSKAAWQWKANGGTTTSVSASGTGSGCVNACTYQANTTAGFSIITYTGRDDQLSNAQESKLTHGLGVAPAFTIMKRTDSAGEWYVMGAFGGSYSPYFNNAYLLLNTTAGINGNYYVGDTAPDSTHIFLGNELVNIASATYVCYAFAEKQGFSKFGSYVGNGNANGPFVYLGFKPAFVMTKKSSAAGGGWFIQDIKRGIRNSNSGTVLKADTTNSEAEIGTTNYDIDFLSNGFKLRDSNQYVNESGTTYIYMAFAENPFTTSTGIPTTAR